MYRKWIGDIGTIRRRTHDIWHSFYKNNADAVSVALEDARERAHSALAFLEEQLGAGTYLLGADFSAADIMIGFTLAAASLLGLLNEHYPCLGAYFERLQARPAFQTAAAKT